MKVGLIGYGKMGKEIEKIAIERGHHISLIIDINNQEDLTPQNLQQCDVVIEFTCPSTAISNYVACFEAGVPVVSGTTGWLQQKGFVCGKCVETDGTFFYASNFSIGVNLFFELNRKLAEMLKTYPQYEVNMKEVHHAEKLDAPSGTAITLAEDIIEIIPSLSGWTIGSNAPSNLLPIESERIGAVPGTHIVTYESDVDNIEIKHTAKNRKGLALGAVLAAEFCETRKGIFTMKDLFNYQSR
ncbi:MAG: 4-hydroxy-tetrahydrodipicolinate reductase [Prolixibacteraceae bacterium]|nr:4-hydroxy-tetrahydrodipicolinate reductase [Prolixibacteraceae bacterium]